MMNNGLKKSIALSLCLTTLGQQAPLCYADSPQNLPQKQSCVTSWIKKNWDSVVTLTASVALVGFIAFKIINSGKNAPQLNAEKPNLEDSKALEEAARREAEEQARKAREEAEEEIDTNIQAVARDSANWGDKRTTLYTLSAYASDKLSEDICKYLKTKIRQGELFEPKQRDSASITPSRIGEVPKKRIVAMCRDDGQFIYSNNLPDIFPGIKNFNIVQAASQFNSLESTSPKHTNVYFYAGDHTQGPQLVLQYPEELLVREMRYFEDLRTGEHRDDILYPVLEKLGLHKIPNLYENGYFTPDNVSAEECANTAKKLLPYIVEHPLQTVTQISYPFGHESKGVIPKDNETMQVFSSAISYQDGINHGKFRHILCFMLLYQQYENLFRIALEEAKNRSGQSIRLHLTAVGGFAFRNPEGIQSLIVRLLINKYRGNLASAGNLYVYLHGSPIQWEPVTNPTLESAIKTEAAEVDASVAGYVKGIFDTNQYLEDFEIECWNP